MNGWISQCVSSCLHWQQGEAFGRHVKTMGEGEPLRGWMRKIGVSQYSNSYFPMKFFRKQVSGDLVSFILWIDGRFWKMKIAITVGRFSKMQLQIQYLVERVLYCANYWKTRSGWLERGVCGRYFCVPSIAIDERNNNSVWQRLQENDFKARGSIISEKPAEQNSILKFPTSENKSSNTS
jgi:hypothetical protein